MHIHTNMSDGSLNVEEVMLAASKSGVTILAITDHETTSAIEKAIEIGFSYGIEVIPGVEFNTFFGNEEIHLLAYYKNIADDRLQEKLVALRQERSEITWRMFQKLKQKGLDLEWEKVEETASPEGIICKTHIMYAIWNSLPHPGQVDWNLISSWFKPGGVAFIPHEGNSYTDAVDFIFASGGIPVLAHPGLIRNKNLIDDLLAYRPIGMEVYYGYWDSQQERISFFEKIAKEKAILSTGGSDYHGFYSLIGIGQIAVPDKCGEDLKHYLQIGIRDNN